MQRFWRVARGLWLVFILGPATGPLVVCRADQRKQAESAASLLKLVDDLVRQRPLTVIGVGRTTQRPLRKVDERSNPYFEVFDSSVDQKSIVSMIELRVPASGAPGNGGLAILTIDRKQCVRPQLVRNHLGREPEDLRPSSPSNPQRSYTFTYTMDGGELRFAFDSGRDCLILVVIDRTEGTAK